MQPSNDWGTCDLCRRDVPKRLITQHHVKPKSEGGRHEHKAPLCKPCHKQVHATFSNKELAKRYADLDALRGAERLQPFLVWIAKQKPDRNFRTISANGHPKSKRR